MSRTESTCLRATVTLCSFETVPPQRSLSSSTKCNRCRKCIPTAWLRSSGGACGVNRRLLWRACTDRRGTLSEGHRLTIRAVHCLDVPTGGAFRTQHEQTPSRSVDSTGTPLPTVRTRPYIVPAFSGTGESVRDSTAPCP